MDGVQTIPREDRQGMKMDDDISSVSYFIMNTLRRHTLSEASSVHSYIITTHCIASLPSSVPFRVLFREFVVAN